MTTGPAVVAVGVDGAPGGWIAAACLGELDDDRSRRNTQLVFRETIAEIDDWRAKRGRDAPTAVDIPIGVLPGGGSRRCDSEARKLLKGSAATVFSPPGRYLLKAKDYKRVRALVARQKKRAKDPDAVPGVSAQSAALIPRIRDVDHYLRHPRAEGGRPRRRPPLFEVHPELCFLRMNQDGPLARKSSAQGQMRRLELIRDHFPDLEDAIEACEWSASGSLIDVLDAYAALWTALRLVRGERLEVLGTGETVEDLPAEISV